MAEYYAFLAIWVLGLFGLIGVCVGLLAKLLTHDSKAYDEVFVWMRKIKE